MSKKVNVRLYLSRLTKAAFEARIEQQKLFTQHGLAIMGKRGKSNIRYKIEGTEFTSSTGEIFYVLCGMIVGTQRKAMEEEFLCAEVHEDAYLELFNKRAMPVIDKSGVEFFGPGVSLTTPVVSMRLDKKSGKLHF